MGVIHVLDEQLTNMIAAGEVVDRPVNIVKECVENSLDAGASRIDIEVFEGGIEGVIVTDDGCGMSFEDARMAFERHATSKITSEEELFSISTMGFRGEALPSIASVARVLLQTSNGQEGTRLEYSYGKLTTYERADVPAGCRMEVRGLFQQTPARFKYLKKAAYEFSVIADAVNKIALAHPEVRFTLRHDGRMIFQTSGQSDRREILFQMFGREAAGQAQSFYQKSDDFTISGFAIQPSISRASKSYIYLCLNGRTIRSWPIVNAVIEGYREYLPKERYPICFLNIETDYQLVDVNVHPNKLEVRISKEDFLTRLIIETISSLFAQEIQAPDLKARVEQPASEQLRVDLYHPQNETVPQKPKGIGQPIQTSSQSQSQVNYPHIPKWPNMVKEDPAASLSDLAKPEVGEKTGVPPENRGESENQVPVFAPDLTFPPVVEDKSERSRENQISSSSAKNPVQYPQGISRPQTNPSGSRLFDQLRVIGQLKDSYILCEGPQGLVIIDQHAAAERANFEKVMDDFEKPVRTMQPLMIPYRKTLSSAMMACLDAINEELSSYGLHFEAISDTSVLLREAPGWLTLLDKDAFLDDLFSWFGDHQEVNMKELRRHLIATIACHSSIRFHRSLRQSEMEQIIEDLRHCRQPYHCPHGRPTVISMSLKELAKEFERG